MKSITASSDDMPEDKFNLARFICAQANAYDRALSEIFQGRKQSHWMWYVFPQLRSLGRSPTAQLYGITGPDEAIAFLNHAILGPRLIAISEATLGINNRSATEIFGKPDDMKLRSCATLFASISEADSVFHQILDRYFDGKPDRVTIHLLNKL